MLVLANCKCTPIGGYIQYNLQMGQNRVPLISVCIVGKVKKKGYAASVAEEMDFTLGRRRRV